jgi:putative tryptophan/tyrosine transport system substrate-binding protein
VVLSLGAAMRRRDFIRGITASTAWPLAAHALQAQPRLVGVLMGFAESDASRSLVGEFRGELANAGWKEGSNLRIELRWGGGDVDRIGDAARELVALRPDAILAQTTPVAAALARETHAIPIVFVTVSDPIGSGLASSLAHPGGNITGFTFVESSMGSKWVELLKEIAPRIERLVLLFNPATAPPLKFYLPSIEAAASSFSIKTGTAPVHASGEIEGAIAALARTPGGGLIVMPDAFTATNRDLIIALAARYSVPALYGVGDNFVSSGGLVAYGPDFAETFRQGAGYVDRILKGANPAELPIQLPAKFELAINLKTAAALGLTIPPNVLAVADEVIE